MSGSWDCNKRNPSCLFPPPNSMYTEGKFLHSQSSFPIKLVHRIIQEAVEGIQELEIFDDMVQPVR